MEGKADAISTPQIYDMFSSVDPEDYSIPILRLALSGLKIEHLPDLHMKKHKPASQERAYGCFCLLSRVGLAFHANPQIEAPAVDLITSQSEGICGWAHWHAIAWKYVLHSKNPTISSTNRQVYIDLAKLLLNVLSLPGDAVLGAFLATRHFVPTLLQLWTATDKDSLYLIGLELQGDPILSLLMETLNAPQGFEAILERLNSRKVDASEFARALTGRVTQARRTISESNPPEGIFSLSQYLVSITEWFLDIKANIASPMLRRAFERTNYLSEFVLLLNFISVAIEQGKVPPGSQLSLHDLVPLLKAVRATIDVSYRAPRNWAKLVEGKIEAVYTRILRATPASRETDYGHIGTTLGVLKLFTVYPAMLNPMIAWGHEDRDSIRNVAVQLPDTDENTIKLKQFMVAGVKRVDIYWRLRESKQLFICDNSSVSIPISWKGTEIC
jgi:hypothetical protein